MSWANEELVFLEGEDGVHLAHPFDEGTLCGVYWEGDDLLSTKKHTVTCRNCIQFIAVIRRVKCSKTPHEKEGAA